MKHDRFYKIHTHLKSRCYNKNDPKYYLYGGRKTNPIIVCDRWLKSFENFAEDMYVLYAMYIMIFGEENTTIERKDVNGPYSPENCTWASPLEQARNRTTNDLITFAGTTLCLSAMAEKYGIKRATLWARIYVSNWSIERALTTPVKKVA